MTTGFSSITAQIDLGSAPFAAAGTWTTLTNVKGINLHAGKSQELGRFDPSTLDITVLNNDRKYDPTNTASALYPNLRPMRKVRLTITDSSNKTVTVWQGFIRPRDGITLNYAPGNTFGTAVLHCVDAFAALAGYQIPATQTRAAELSGARVTWVLGTLLGIDSSLYSVATGITLLGPGVFGTNALDYLQRVAEEEGGAFYVNGAEITFDDRFAPINQARMTTSQATVTDTTDFTSIAMEYANRIYNDAQFTAETGTLWEQTDATSVTNYTQTSYVINAPEISDEEAEQRALWIVKQYKDPTLVPGAITFKPNASTTLSDMAIHRELRDHITVHFTPVGSTTGQASYDCFIDAIDYVITEDDWTVTYKLSPVRFGFTNYNSYIRLAERTDTGITLTNGQNTFTDATATAADIGKYVYAAGMIAAGTTVTNVVGTTVTISAAASGTTGTYAVSYGLVDPSLAKLDTQELAF